jgi:phage tail sheath gpL-like
MSQAAPVNTDVPSSWMIPGTYLKLDLNGAGAGLNNVQKRVLLVGTKSSSGVAAQDTVVQVTGQSLADLNAGRGSDLARLFAAAQSQVGGGACDFFLLPIVEPSGGTAATRKIIFDVSSGSTAAAQDAINITICGYQTSVVVASGDSMTTIGANVAAAINLLKDIPVTAGASSGTVTLTYRVKGAHGEDLPVMVEIPNATTSLLRASCGTVTYATNASGAGSATVSVGGTTYSAAIANADTPTVIATAMDAAIAAVAGPVTSSFNAGVLTLYYAAGRVVQRPSAAIVTTTGTTATVAAGTAGAGTPTLSTALANLAGQGAFGEWSTCFNDTTSLGTLSSHIETYANGLYQKDQFLWAASTNTLTTAGAIPSGTTPALTASGRYHIGWCMDSPQQAYELAARHAAMVCAEDFKPHNYDGEEFQSQTATVPLLMPHRNSRPSPADQNSAMRSYYMTPYVVDEQANKLVVLRGRTTSNASDERLWDTGLWQTAAFVRYDMGTFLRKTFKGKSLKSSGIARTPNTVTVDDIVDAIAERLQVYESADFYDGADELKKIIRANINVLSPTRVDCYIPFRCPVPLHVVAPVVGLV